MDGRKFHLEINSIDEFLIFVSIVKGEGLERLRELTSKLTDATDKLVEAEKKQLLLLRFLRQ